MSAFLDLLVSTATQGLIYALLSYGIFITYKILDFPDLTVDGSFPLGAAVTAVLLVNGVDPYLTLIAAMAVGALAGLVLEAPAWLTIICLRIDYAIKSFWCIGRLNGGRWIRETEKLPL